MTAYGQPSRIAPSLAVKVARERRRKVLEAARRVRRANYIRFYRKMQTRSRVTA